MAQLVSERIPTAVYIGRAGRGEDGYFGNPCAVGKFCSACRRFHVDAADAVAAFEAYFSKRVAVDREFATRVLALEGRALWCPGRCVTKGSPCHGKVIVAWITTIVRLA